MNNSATTRSLVQRIEIPEVYDEGLLHFAEVRRHIPFSIKRFYLISNVVDHAVRGRHAHRKTKQVLFCISGSITLILDNGAQKEAVTLKKPNVGILLDTMLWHEMVAFNSNTILLVVASEYFKESDYIRDYREYLSLQGKTKKGEAI